MGGSPERGFHKGVLHLDAGAACEEIAGRLRGDVLRTLRRRGAVVGISGGVDSSVTLALSARALGPERVMGVIMPERDTDPRSLTQARLLADRFDVPTVVEDLTGALEGLGCYRRRDEAIARVFPGYDPRTHRVKIGLPQGVLDRDTLNLFSITVVAPDGTEERKRLPLREYLQIVAASNFKQRSRMAMLYYHAESLNYAVVGTANRHEHEQGFFVKYGDGGADVMPIVHLYKTQVYQLARYLRIPDDILSRPPTSDTYSAACTQEEFFFQMPFEQMDLLWYAHEEGCDAGEVAGAMGLTEEQVLRAFRNFERKRRTTGYLRTGPICHSCPGSP
jgi:NAD+ synthase